MTPNRFAKIARHKPGTMNKLEASYAARLELLKAAGEVLSYSFECAKFKLAPLTFYTPDFMVIAADGVIEFHETKGGLIMDDAMVKLKVFAALYPFRVYLCQYKNAKTGWTFKHIS